MNLAETTACAPSASRRRHGRRAGNALLFAAPKDIADFLSCYSAATRDDIRRNRGNIADRLGFMGRVMHGRNPKSWLRDIGTRTGAALFVRDS
jgi:hypothetical protein